MKCPVCSMKAPAGSEVCPNCGGNLWSDVPNIKREIYYSDNPGLSIVVGVIMAVLLLLWLSYDYEYGSGGRKGLPLDIFGVPVIIADSCLVLLIPLSLIAVIATIVTVVRKRLPRR
jgi:hypothetical protein